MASKKIQPKIEKEKGEISQKKVDTITTVSIVLVIGLLIFAAFLFIKYFNKFSIEASKDPSLKVQDLHRQNIEGKLKPEEGYIYEKYSFVRFSNRWHTQVKKDGTIYEVQFYFDPKSVENVSLRGKINASLFSNNTVYISINPIEADKWTGLAVADTSLTLTKYMAIYPVSACGLNETAACEFRPIVNCNDKDKAVIYYAYGNETSVFYDDNCIRITGNVEVNGTEIIRAADRFLYDLYNII